MITTTTTQPLQQDDGIDTPTNNCLDTNSIEH